MTDEQRVTAAQAACPKCKETPGWHADLHAGHVWTNVDCPAYRTQDGDDCTCGGRAPTAGGTED